MAFLDIGRNAQRVVCMLLSAVIVGASLSSLSLGAHEAQAGLRRSYSVIVTQLPSE